MITQNTFLNSRKQGGRFIHRKDRPLGTHRRQDESMLGHLSLLSPHVEWPGRKIPVCAIVRPELQLQGFNLVTG